MNSVLITVLSLSVSGSAIALLLFAGKSLVKNKVSKAFSYYIWLLVLLRLVLPIAAPVNVMNTLFHVQWSNTAQAEPSLITSAVGQPDKLSGDVRNNQTDSSVTRNNATAHSNTKGMDSFFVSENALWIWLVGSIINLGWFVTAYVYYSCRIRHSCVAPHPDDLIICKEMCGNPRVRFVCSSVVTTPILLGIIRPVIVLPHSAYAHKELGNELRNILRHELTHYRRKDVLYKWLVMAVTSLHWFNPLMPMIRKEISKACELSCDEAVISKMSADEKLQYGNTLLAFSAGQKIPSGTLATSLSTGKLELKERLMNITKYRKKSTFAIALSLVLGLFLVGCATTLGFAADTNSPAPSSPNSSTVTSPGSATDSPQVNNANNTSPVPSGATLNPTSTNEGKGYYGNWKTTKCIAKSVSYALSDEEINEQIGTTVSYENNLYKKGTAEIELTGYDETTADSTQFQENFGISLPDIGITEDTSQAVAVGAEGDFFGGTFYIKDNNTLIIYYDGVFFEATRV